ncbi:hypothetical protein B0H15DRAFT_952271 [Mycena belliarum]|uniref:AB hydrolase-1 domain-containing protein n=1 Tax=Mycena belliarum TaxID=1033014 RepID=A0AAD6U0M5_9AGAR|nr:hypothetical protein B0H15DRAFT_952271 [Mycena belliae]
MVIRSFILSPAPPPGRKALKMEVKRYTSGSSLPEGVTLLMLHGLGQHKEQWEPVVERLYAPQSHCTVSPPIREIWSLEWQSHGQSAVLNEEALKDDPLSALMDQWAHGIAEFIKSDFVKGHRLVGVGYSSGAIALMVSTMYFEKCPYLGCILVEPTIADKDTWQSNLETVIQPGFDLVNKAVTRRRNAWANRDEAQTFFAGRSPWKTIRGWWSYSKDKDDNDCVTRKCPTIHEATAPQVNDKAPWAAADHITKLCGTVPIHAILAELVDSHATSSSRQHRR